MTDLTKPVTRKTPNLVYNGGGRYRNIVVTLEPAGRDNAMVGVRLSGTRQTYRIGVQSILNQAIELHHQKIDRKAKELHKTLGISMRSAKARARTELAKELL